MVETAFVLPVVILMLFSLIFGGLMVFSYQQMANMAREGARWASVHGAQHAADNKTTAPTEADVYSNAILPRAVGLDTSKLTYSVTWSNSGKWAVYADPKSNPPGQPVGTTVTVTVSYDWYGFTLSSTSVMPMTY
jgi:Flp pilus assembly protein TadG